MKKLLAMSLLAATAFTFVGCAGEEDDIFSKSAAERLNEAGDIYTERLIAADGGWAMEYYPTNLSTYATQSKYELDQLKSSGYLLLARFNTDRSVTMASLNDINADVYRTPYVTESSTWDVIADNGPVLSFDSYNKVLHVFSDPGIIASELGLGFEGDYEFVVIDLPEDGDYAMLKGKKRGTYVRMTRLAAGTDFAEYLQAVQSFKEKMFPEDAINECLLTIGDKAYSVAKAGSGLMGLYPEGGDALTETTYHPYLITLEGDKYHLRFRDEVKATSVTTDENGETVITADEDAPTVQEFVYDAATDRFNDVEGKGYQIAPLRKVGSIYLNWLNAAEANRWQFSASTEKSADLQEALETMITQLNGSSYRVTDPANTRTVNVFRFVMNGEQLQLEIHIEWTRGRRFDIAYNFDVAETEDGITLTYKEPSADTPNAAALLSNTKLTGIASFLNALSGTYKVTGVGSDFVLNTIELADGSKTLQLNSITK